MIYEKVGYCTRLPTKRSDLMGNEIDVIDTFVYNPNSKTSPNTARKWAKSPWGTHQNYQPEMVVYDNEPFQITILSLEVRSEGGRAYKVIDKQNRCFDLREDQLIEAIKTCGINPGGVIPAQFIWGSSGSQMKLFMLNGKAYLQEIEEKKKKDEEAKRVKIAALSLTKLVPGRIYVKAGSPRWGWKELALYIGKVTAPVSDVKKLTQTYHAFYMFTPDFTNGCKRANYYDGDYQARIDEYDKLTDVQKIERYIENISYKSEYEHGSPRISAITLTNSVKLVEELDFDAKALANDLRENKHNVSYENGNGKSLAEILNPTPRPSYGYHNFGSVSPYNVQQNAVKSNNAAYRDKLVWID